MQTKLTEPCATQPTSLVLTKQCSFVLPRSLFTKSPESKILFGFPIDIDPTSKVLLESRRFRMHATYMIEMLDTALNLLGPDIDLLTEVLYELGAKHQRYGVKREMFVIMGDALITMLAQVLGPDNFDEATREAWQDTYAEISRDMVLAQKKTRRR